MGAQFAQCQPSHPPAAQEPDPQEIAHLTTLLGQQQFAEGASTAEEFTKRWPDHPLGWTVLGMCLTALGSFQDAEPALRQAVQLAPNNAAVANCLGVVLKALGKAAEARSVFDQALSNDETFMEARFNLAQTLRDLDLHDETLKELRTVLARRPDDTSARMALAHSLKETGALAEGEEQYRALANHEATRPEAYFHLSTVKTFTREDADLKAILALLNRKPDRPNDRIHLHFAAGKALQDVNDDPATAFVHYQSANAMKRAALHYDVRQDVASLAKVQRHFPNAQPLVQAPWGDGFGPSPIFIVGMPRSGTTLIEQILASHQQVSPGGERTDLERSAKALEAKTGVPFPAWEDALGAGEAEELSGTYLGALHAVDPAARWITDKGRKNLKLLGVVAKALPGAKIIHVRRQPLDTCFSCYTQLFAEGNLFSYDLLDLATYYTAHQSLAAHWEKVLPSGQLRSVDYETLIAEPEDTIRGLLEFCALEWDDNCLHFHNTARPVKTPSAVQVRTPLYRSSVGRWEPYKDHLAPLIQGLSNGSLWVPGSAIC
ncbi:MAG: tetratricopeptide repeat protein [Alphaproteobacteria bacterium]|nr:tetratricopeptide repeat protein [Alphaproteobacteria bacterium]